LIFLFCIMTSSEAFFVDALWLLLRSSFAWIAAGAL
jgi:hypothetical protein